MHKFRHSEAKPSSYLILVIFFHNRILGQENFPLKSAWIFDKICLTTKQRKFAKKVASRQKQRKLPYRSTNSTLCVKLHTMR